jgi:hypothetical protein
MHNADKNPPLTCPIEGCKRHFRSVPGLEYHLKKHVDGKIFDEDGNVLLCPNPKAAKRQAMNDRKSKILNADVAREMAASEDLVD